jgi:hypothetical protein
LSKSHLLAAFLMGIVFDSGLFEVPVPVLCRTTANYRAIPDIFWHKLNGQTPQVTDLVKYRN